ncbi:MAG: competence protein ComEC family protein [Treponema sp.]|nr:competence protein ComEC family protein [Treponema sp.]
MKNYLRPTPVFCTAAGAVIGFYFLHSLMFASLLVFMSTAIILLMLVFSFSYFCRYAARIDYRFKLGRRLKLVSICVFVFVCGLAIGISAANAGLSRQKFAVLPEKITAIEGVLLEDPRIISGGNVMALVSLRKCASISPNSSVRATSSGRITVFFPAQSAEKLREFGRGASVYSEGMLRPSPTAEGEWTFSANTIFVVKPAPPVERMRTGIRIKLIEKADSKEWGALALALLLGIKDNLDSDLSDMYRKAGCSYILALSGMHLAVLAAIIAFLLKPLLGLKPASIAGAVIICLYCFLTGPMPSLNRAALMYILGVVAILGFLPKQPMAILSLSFLIQIIITPAAGHTISFILSYAALAGIFVIGQPFYELLAGKIPDFLLQPLSASCGAFLATAGITGFLFGYIAPIGILVGLVLVPLTTLYMILSLVWLVLDFGWLLSPLYRVKEWLVGLAAKVPAISADKPVVILVVSIIAIVLIIVLENKFTKDRLKPEPFLW